MGLFFLFCFSWFKSCKELKYATTATAVEAEIRMITEEHNRSGRHTGYRLYYVFEHADRGKLVRGNMAIGPGQSGKYAEGDKVTIEYFGEEKMFSSRIVGTGNYVWGTVFIGSLVLMVAGVFYLLYGPTKMPT